MRSVLSMAALVLLAASPASFAYPCEFREPRVNFEGITTKAQMDEYLTTVFDQVSDDQDRVFKCIDRWSDAQTHFNGESVRQQDAMSDQWLTDSNRFIRQVEMAAKDHLAMIASQPAPGTYTGQGMSSGGARSNASSAPATSAGETPTAKSKQDASSGAISRKGMCDSRYRSPDVGPQHCTEGQYLPHGPTSTDK